MVSGLRTMRLRMRRICCRPVVRRARQTSPRRARRGRAAAARATGEQHGRDQEAPRDVRGDRQAQVAGVDVRGREGPDHGLAGGSAPYQPGQHQIDRRCTTKTLLTEATKVAEKIREMSFSPSTVIMSAGLATKNASRISIR